MTASTSSHIDYEAELNSRQLEAVTVPAGPVLVIAGAGSGKTRTIVYRVAWLVERGIEPARMRTKGFGPDQPVADNATPEGRAQNRRIEFLRLK